MTKSQKSLVRDSYASHCSSKEKCKEIIHMMDDDDDDDDDVYCMMMMMMMLRKNICMQI